MSSKRVTAALILSSLLAVACGGGGSGDPEVNVIDPLPQKRGLLPSIATADAAFNDTHHAGGGVCAECHDADVMSVPDESGTDRNVSLNRAWRTSMMANSARDPYWHAVVAWELDEHPAHTDEINDTCTVCHAPMANDYARKEGVDLTLFSNADESTLGIFDRDATDSLFNHAMDGVSCSLCHQIDAGNLGDESSFSGGYEILDARNLESRPAYGQYPNPVSGYMQTQTGSPAEGIPGFLAQEAAHISTSETCATCHNLDVAPLDANGEPLGGAHFSEQANYTEWLYSDYRTGGPLETTCQECHMPRLDSPVVIADGTVGGPRDDFAEHTFLGANTVVQSMLRDFADELGVNPDITEAEFNESIARNRAFLETAATLTVSDITRSALPAAEGQEPEEQLSFDVVIENNTGHKLPTGYHSRRVYLHVLVTSDEGVVWESGPINEAGRIAGLSEDVNAHSWESHYDVITDPSQVQVYQAVVGNSEGDRTASLLDGSQYLKDNRILPKGYRKFEVQADPARNPSFGTFGVALSDPDFNNGFDTVTYQPRVPAGGDYRVLVELRYQPLAYGHLQELFLKSGRLDVVDMFRTIYDATELRDEVIATATARLDAN